MDVQQVSRVARESHYGLSARAGEAPLLSRELSATVARGRGRSTTPAGALGADLTATLLSDVLPPIPGMEGDEAADVFAQVHADELAVTGAGVDGWNAPPGRIPTAPVQHLLPEHAQSSLSAEERKVMWMQEWSESYAREVSPAVFQSAALYLEMRLRRANIFAEKTERPAELPTAVAFQVLTALSTVFGRYRPLLRAVLSTLLEGTYAEVAADPRLLRSLLPSERLSRAATARREAVGLTGPSPGGGEGRLGPPMSDAEEADRDQRLVRGGPSSLMSQADEQEWLMRFYRLTPHFSVARRLAAERSKLKAVVKHLRKTLVRWEKARQSELERLQTRGNILARWRTAANAARHTREVSSMTSALQQQRAAIEAVVGSMDRNGGRRGRRWSVTLREATAPLSAPGAEEAPALARASGGAPAQDVEVATGISDALGGDDAEEADVEAPGLSASEQRELMEEIRELFSMMRSRGDLQLACLLRLLGDHAVLVPALTDELMGRSDLMPLRPALQVVTSVLTERKDVGLMDLVTVVTSIVRAPDLRANPVQQSNLLREVILATQEVWPASEALLHQLSPLQRACASRYTIGLDSRLLSPAELGDHLQGHRVEGVSEMQPGDWTKGLLEHCSEPEKLRLLNDLLGSMGASALEECILPAMVDEDGPLRAAAESLDPMQRDALLRVLCDGMQPSELQQVLADPPSDGAGASGKGGEGGSAGAGKGASGKRKRRQRPKDEVKSSLLAFFRKPPRSVVKGKRQRMNAASALSLVLDTYEKKIKEDAAHDKRGSQRQSMEEYIKDFVLQKYGIPSLADGYLYALIQTVNKGAKRSHRLKVFGQLLGVIDSNDYSPRLAGVYLRMLDELFQHGFTATALRRRKAGSSWVAMDRVMAVLPVVFPAESVPFSTDTVCLSDHRRMKLNEDLLAASKHISELPDQADPPIGAVSEKRSRRAGVDLPPAPAGSAADPSFSSPRAGSAGSAKRGQGRAGSASSTTRGAGTSMQERVVDLDECLDICLASFRDQFASDMRLIKRLFEKHDEDGNGVLSYAEFDSLLRACLANRSDTLESSQVTSMFQRCFALQKQLDNGAEDDEDDDDSDSLSPDAFALMCDRYGIIPKRKLAPSGASEASIAVDGDVHEGGTAAASAGAGEEAAQDGGEPLPPRASRRQSTYGGAVVTGIDTVGEEDQPPPDDLLVFASAEPVMLE